MSLGYNEIIGNNQFLGTSGPYLPKDINSVTSYLNPADKGIEPFLKFDASTTTYNDYTGYAVRNEKNTIEAYMVVFGDREVREGDKIVVGLRDSWSFDWYFWQTYPLKPFKLPVGSFYTLDFTQKVGDKYLYESYPAINLRTLVSRKAGMVATKNIGATTETDPGYYFMFGYDTPIFPGGKYPNSPRYTPYYYYQKDESKDSFAYCGISGGNSTSGVATNYHFVSPSTFTVGGLIGSGSEVPEDPDRIELNGGSDSPLGWWRKWTNLGDNPIILGDWGVPRVITFNNIKTGFKDRNIIGRDGAVDNTADPAAVFVENKRTGHGVLFPVSGVLVPSAEDNEHRIKGNATAEVLEGTEKLAIISQACISMNLPTGGQKSLKLAAYTIDASTTECKIDTAYYHLNNAVPFRPTYYENPSDLKELVSRVKDNAPTATP